MKLKGSQLRSGLSALLDGLPEAFVADALGVSKATVRYWRAHEPSAKVASALIGVRMRPREAPPEPTVKAVKS